jgi:hypothetical protein
MNESICRIKENGNKFWYLNNQRHRTDGPAVEFTNGDKYWYLNGQLHREDGPAIEWANGNKSWYLNNHRHRTDGPAVEFANGNKKWWLNGKEYEFLDWAEKVGWSRAQIAEWILVNE